MNILIISRNLPPLIGGMETVLAAVTRGLAATATVDVIGPHGFSEVRVRTVWAGPFPILGFYLKGLLAIARMRSGQYDCVVAGSILMAPLARIAALRVGGPFVVLAHGLDVTYANRVYQALFLAAARRARLVIANSRFTAAQLRLRGFSERMIQVLFPGIDLPSRLGDADRFRRHHGLGDAPVLLGVGRIIPRKGFLEFVRDVLPLVLQQIPQARFVLIGAEPPGCNGELVQAIGRLAKELGIEDHVVLPGSMIGDDLADAYAAANVHVFPVRDLPGDPEGFGLVALEAAACGVATVAYAHGGITDAIHDGVSGALVQGQDPVAFGKAVVGLLKNIPDRAPMAAHAEKFAWERYVQQLFLIIDKL